MQRKVELRVMFLLFAGLAALAALSTVFYREAAEVLVLGVTRQSREFTVLNPLVIAGFSLIVLAVCSICSWLVLAHLKKGEENRQVLAESEEGYRELCDSANDLIDVLTPEGKVLYANAAWQRALGYRPEEVSGLTLKDVVHPDDWPQSEEGLRRLAAGNGPSRFEVRFRAKDSSTIFLEGTVSCRRVEGKPVVICGILRDITERKRAELQVQQLQQRLKESLAKEQELARIDPLTHVANRRAFYEVAEAESARARRYRRPISVAYLDIDDFKRVNDTLGHSTGDALLVSVASTLRSQLRTTDVVARMGGDEFALMLPETDATSAQVVLEKLQRALLETARASDWQVTFSIGAASFVTAPDSLDTMLRLADEELYAIKAQGKNRVSVAVVS